ITSPSKHFDLPFSRITSPSKHFDLPFSRITSPSKHFGMPSKNSPSNVAGEKDHTMQNEYIVVMRKEST
ncbi:hypothetical protein L6R29_20230, partial [Myxococcota bacterium]|nr:hypothetical protein [Myxococcota bacterium]